MRRLNGGEIQISDVTTTTPSATSLLFGYVAEFMYQSDAPLAERRASVLSLDSELLRNLLGQVDPGELLDPQVIRQVEEELQRLAPGRRAKDEEGLFDLLRELGPMTVEDLAQRHTGSSEEVASYLENLLAVKRIFPAMISGQERLACMDDAARLRDASAYDYQSHCQRFIYIESVTRFAISFCAISGLMLWSRLNNWLMSLVSVLPLSKSSFSNCVNRVW